MRVFRNFDDLPEISVPVVTIGSFDGVHRGHRLLISQLCQIARQNRGESVVVTFDPHPRQVLHGDNKLLSTLDEKLILLAETGVDNIIVVDFTKEFSRISHSKFIENYIVGKLRTKIMVTGQEHHFGHNREGDADDLARFGVETKQLERYDNISSTQIRQAIEKGKIRQAVELLGTGGYLVRTPLTEQSKLLPPDGKYIVEIDGVRAETIISGKLTSDSTQNIRIIREL